MRPPARARNRPWRSSMWSPLGKNIGGYKGECIDIQSVLEEIQASAFRHQWKRDSFCLMPGVELIAYRRAVPNPRRRLYLSTGIHGDEPAGPLAIRELLREDHWPKEIEVWLCPCLNLTGFPLNTRENARGIDLNRDYRHLSSEEIRTHVAWLQQQPNFDLAVSLHEDWESKGFYLYELNPDNRPSFAELIVQAVSEVCPIDTSSNIEGWVAKDGVIRPDKPPNERPQWPETIYLINSNKTRQSYTLEAPSDFPIPVRVRALETAVKTVLKLLAER